MKKLIAGGAAIVLAAGMGLAAVAPASAQYYGWHHWHHWHGGYWGGPGPAIGAGILGFAAGAAIANADRDRDVTDHVDACEAAYKSYDPRSDTYLGYDGARHRCDL